MFISCSCREEIWEIPRAGVACVAGYWNPEEFAPNSKSTLIEWQDGILTSLKDYNEIPKSEEVYNWTDFYIMPGWLDAHVHLALDSIDFSKSLKNWSHPALMHENLEKILRRYLELGIVGIRDGGDLTGYGWLAKKKISDGKWVGPKVQSVREAVYRVGSYGKFLGVGFKNIEDWRAKRDGFFALGQDQLKVIVSGLISFRKLGVVGPVQWSLAELQQVVNDAHEQGIRVMAHVSGEEAITIAIKAGVDSLEHGYYITHNQLTKLLEKGISWIPTVAPVGNLLARATKRYTIEEKSVLRSILRRHLDSIYEAYQLKVSLGVGTDAGAYHVPHAESLLDEMMWFAESGIPTLEVRRMASLENAKIMGWSDFGRLQLGTAMDTLQLSDHLFGTFACSITKKM
ncbi:MAG: amidohydrolase family protein [Desulfitobacteriaceae bacterium]